MVVEMENGSNGDVTEMGIIPATAQLMARKCNH
jgi:hypothetical protein